MLVTVTLRYISVVCIVMCCPFVNSVECALNYAHYVRVAVGCGPSKARLAVVL